MPLRQEAILNMENSIQNAATKKMMNGESSDKEKDPKSLEGVSFLSPEKMEEWNQFVDYVEKRGFRGDASLDKEDKGNLLFEEWRKLNPKVTITKADMPSVRKSMLRLREDAMEDIKKGGEYTGPTLGKQTGPNANFGEFMRHLLLNEQSNDPNYIGHRLTMTRFPRGKAQVKSKETGQVLEEKQLELRKPGEGTIKVKEALEKMGGTPNRPPM
jgi:hypothetical protein